MAEILNIVRFTHTEEFSYNRDLVLEVADSLAKQNLITIGDRMTLDDIIREVFEATYDSLLGNELFYGLDDLKAGVELITRRDDE